MHGSLWEHHVHHYHKQILCQFFLPVCTAHKYPPVHTRRPCGLCARGHSHRVGRLLPISCPKPLKGLFVEHYFYLNLYFPLIIFYVTDFGSSYDHLLCHSLQRSNQYSTNKFAKIPSIVFNTKQIIIEPPRHKGAKISLWQIIITRQFFQ